MTLNTTYTSIDIHSLHNRLDGTNHFQWSVQPGKLQAITDQNEPGVLKVNIRSSTEELEFSFDRLTVICVVFPGFIELKFQLTIKKKKKVIGLSSLQ